MATTITRIALKKDKFEALRKSLNVSRAAMYDALNGSSNSETAQQIRRLAISLYEGRKATKVIW